MTYAQFFLIEIQANFYQFLKWFYTLSTFKNLKKTTFLKNFPILSNVSLIISQGRAKTLLTL